MSEPKLEVWMRGPVEGIIPLLQPVAHAILQAGEEVNALMLDFPDSKLWITPAGMASVGFHLQHLSGVLDRLFTYSLGKSLTPEQLLQLQQEGKSNDTLTSAQLLQQLNAQIDRAIEHLKSTPESDLLTPRGIGRKQIPTNVIGLLFHAAEHTQRHTGQLLVTVNIVQKTDLQSS